MRVNCYANWFSQFYEYFYPVLLNLWKLESDCFAKNLQKKFESIESIL